ncbi:MAG TPA: M1 family metallopeptidase [Candidatus Angelobacter sp.]|jgi:aminopeptidase N/puromycin-sensitive aminopeptidase
MHILQKLACNSFLICSVLAGAQRLPHTVVPEHYAIAFTPDLAGATFSGDELIRVKINRPGKSIILNAAELQIQKAVITQGLHEQEAHVSLDTESEQAKLTVSGELAVGPATLHIHFTGILNEKLHGFYLSKTGSRRYAITQFEPTDARRAFPCFDEPEFKATFNITLTIDNGDTAISNGSLLSDTVGPAPGEHTLRFSTTPRMSTYLVAMAVGRFQCARGNVSNIPVRICGTPENDHLAKVAMRYTFEILQYYNHYYGIKYPYGKLDIVGLPEFAGGAMENTAAIFYRESLLFIDEKNSSVESHLAVFLVLAHEISHHWLGNLVTMQWWDNLWLNEGLASWMERKPAQELHHEWNVALDALNDTNTALQIDSLRDTHPIRAKVETSDDIHAMFDPITYDKGAAIIRMVESYVGPETFRRGINTYLRKFQFRNATAEDFWTVMSQVSGRPIDRIMRRFVSQPGEPLVTVKAECSTTKARSIEDQGAQQSMLAQQRPSTDITLTQQRFFHDGDMDNNSQLWLVPVCIKTGDGETSCHLLQHRQTFVRIAGCMPWVFANTNAVGYFRTQYAPDNLKMLAAVVATRLSTPERVSLLNDEAALVTAGKEKIGSLLDLISVVNKKPQADIVESYRRTLEVIDSHLVTVGNRESYHLWLRKTFHSLLAQIGWTASPQESGETRSLRANLIGILGKLAQDPETVTKSTALAHQYLQDPASVDSTLARSVLQVAARAGSAALLNDYLKALPQMNTPEEVGDLQQSLAEFRGPELVGQVLSFDVSSEVRDQDAPSLIAAVLANPANQDFAWQWIKTHWEDVERKITGSSGVQIVYGAGRFCDAGHRDEVQEFFTQHKLLSSERVLKQMIERINSCIKYRDRQQDKLALWLYEHNAMDSKQ